MSSVKATVRKIETGFILVPNDEAALHVVAYLYCPFDNAVEMYRQEVREGTMGHKTMEEFIAHVLETARSNKIEAEAEGDTITLTPAVQSKNVPVVSREVNLKWSAWTTDDGIWGERAPGVLEEMRAAFDGTGPSVEVSSAPHKEIRYGVVTVSRGKAEGHFVCEWDDVDDLASTLGLTDEEGHWIDRTGMTEEELSEKDQEHWDDMDRQAFAESLPFSSYAGEPGVDRDFEVQADTFDSLMAKIDNEEAECMADSEKQWNEVEAMYRTKKGGGV